MSEVPKRPDAGVREGQPSPERGGALMHRSAGPSGDEPMPGFASHRAQASAQESAALAAEKSLRSEWRICRADGTSDLVDDYPMGGSEGESLQHLVAYERDGTRTAEDAPAHVRLMREHELVGYESASDTGNLRWYPNGILVKRLLEQHVTSMVTDYGAMEVETPLMYDFEHPALSKYLQRSRRVNIASPATTRSSSCGSRPVSGST